MLTAHAPLAQTPSMTRQRLLLALAGLTGTAAFLALWHDQIGHTGKTAAGALWQNLGFFTDLGNLTVAIVFTAAAARATWAGPRALGQATVAILLVGVGYWTIGRGYLVFGRLGLGDILAHGVTPVVAPLAWLLAAPKAGIGWRDAGRWLAFPALYLPYAIGRGLLTGAYPYGWMNGARHGWDSVAVFVAIFVAITLALGLLVVAAARLLARTAK